MLKRLYKCFPGSLYIILQRVIGDNYPGVFNSQNFAGGGGFEANGEDEAGGAGPDFF